MDMDAMFRGRYVRAGQANQQRDTTEETRRTRVRPVVEAEANRARCVVGPLRWDFKGWQPTDWPLALSLHPL